MSAHAAVTAAVPLAEVLSIVQQELLTLQDLSTDAQLVMGFALQRAELDPGQWSRAQSLDLITQRLSCLAAFLLALGRDLPADWLVDPGSATADVTLSDLLGRLLQVDAIPMREGESIELF